MEPKIPVLICTKHRGVFFGYIDAKCIELENLHVTECRMAIYWGTTKGVMELADTGPTEISRIGAPTDCFLRDVTAVFHVKKEAEKKWIG